MIIPMQERGSKETEGGGGGEGEGSSKGSVTRDCLEGRDKKDSFEGRDSDNEQGAKLVQPKTPVLRKVVKED